MIQSSIAKYKREASVAVCYLLLVGLVTIASPSFLQVANIRDLAMNNAAVLIVAVGMTLVILTGEIDISVGSQFAVCTYLAGSLSKFGLSVFLLLPVVVAAGAGMGGVAGFFVGRLMVASVGGALC